MAARSIWNGALRIGKTSFPVQLFSAVQDKSVHFHLLDAQSHTRVKQHMVDPESGAEVPSGEIRKALQLKPGLAVVITDEDKAALQTEPSRDIEVLHFLPEGTITHQWYERPYYIGAANDADDYSALSAALRKTNREGLAKWTMRGKQYFGALRERDGYLLLVELRYVEEVVSARDLPIPSGRSLDQREINMALQLVDTLRDEFDPQDFHDEYRERVMKFIEEKASGAKPKLAVMPKKRAAPPLLAALEASLKGARKQEKQEKRKGVA